MSAIFAYFDPGSGSLLLQVILGGAAGLLVFGKYLWNAAAARLRSPGEKRVRRKLPEFSASSSGEIPQMP